MKRDRTFTELARLQTFDERFKYLMLKGRVGIETFGYDRYLNQALYHSPDWKRVRDQIIIRDNGCDLGIEDHPIGDNGCDLGIEDHPIGGNVFIHHMNPITIDDVLNSDPDVFNPEYLICVSHKTHNAIHYGYEEYPESLKLTERKPNDTIPWR